MRRTALVALQNRILYLPILYACAYATYIYDMIVLIHGSGTSGSTTTSDYSALLVLCALVLLVCLLAYRRSLLAYALY